MLCYKPNNFQYIGQIVSWAQMNQFYSSDSLLEIFNQLYLVSLNVVAPLWQKSSKKFTPWQNDQSHNMTKQRGHAESTWKGLVNTI